MKIAICLFSLFVSAAPLQAMNDDVMEIDNGSPREQEHVKAVVFRAIDVVSSPMTQSQSLDSKNNIAPTTRCPQSCTQELGSSDLKDRGVDLLELDLGALAMDPDAMDMDDK